MLGRLPVLLVIALGYWLWNDPGGAARRELVFELQGPDRADVRTFEVQVMGADGALLERVQRFYRDAPPREIRVDARLPQERLELLLFAQDAGGRALPLEKRALEITGRLAYRVRVTVRRPQEVPGSTGEAAAGAVPEDG